MLERFARSVWPRILMIGWVIVLSMVWILPCSERTKADLFLISSLFLLGIITLSRRAVRENPDLVQPQILQLNLSTPPLQSQKNTDPR